MFKYNGITLRQKLIVEAPCRNRDKDDIRQHLDLLFTYGIVKADDIVHLKGEELLNAVFSYSLKYDILPSIKIVENDWVEGDTWSPIALNTKTLLKGLSYAEALIVRKGIYLLEQSLGFTSDNLQEFIRENSTYLTEDMRYSEKRTEDGGLTESYVEYCEELNAVKRMLDRRIWLSPGVPCTKKEFFSEIHLTRDRANKICKAIKWLVESGLNLEDVFGTLISEDYHVFSYGFFLHCSEEVARSILSQYAWSTEAQMVEFIGKGPAIDTTILKKESAAFYKNIRILQD